FKSEEYWKITALLAPEGTVQLKATPLQAKFRKKSQEEKELEEAAILKPEPGTFLAELAEWDGQKFQGKTEEQVKPIVTALEGAAYVVAKVEQKDRPEKAAPPFTTSTLQQQANIRLGYSAKRTMRLAQELYEGVDLGTEGSVALITYMRTDSTR